MVRAFSEDRAIGVAAAALTIVVALPFIDDDFDYGFEAFIGSRFQGPIQRAWLRGGFVAMRGRPVTGPLPTTPPSGFTYASHPPLAHWLFHLPVLAFGLDEWTLRLVPILATALAGALLAMHLARLHGLAHGLAAAAIWPAIPMIFFYGRMANYESPVLLLGLVALAANRRGDRAGDIGCWVAIFLATLCDWAGGFFVPVIGLAGLLGGRRLVPGLIAASATIAAVLVYLGILMGWEGGWNAALEALDRARNLATESDFDLPAFIANQALHLRIDFGFSGLSACVVAAIVSLRALRGRRAGFLHLAVIAALFTSAVNVALFPARAYNHDFWWYYLSPAAVIGAAWIVGWIAPRSRIAALVVVILFVAEGAVEIDRRYRDENRGDSRETAAAVDRRFGPRDLLIVAGGRPLHVSWQFLCKPWVHDEVGNRLVAEQLYERFMNGEFDVEHLGFWYPVRLDHENPEMLQLWKDRGAEHKTFGASAILKIPRR